MKNLSVFILILLVGTFVFSQEIVENDTPKYYENAKVIRIKYKSGETYIKRDYNEGLEEASLNLPVFENDIVGTTAGRTELYLGRLNYLRLDQDTEVSLEKIPMLRKTDLVIIFLIS